MDDARPARGATPAEPRSGLRHHLVETLVVSPQPVIGDVIEQECAALDLKVRRVTEVAAAREVLLRDGAEIVLLDAGLGETALTALVNCMRSELCMDAVPVAVIGPLEQTRRFLRLQVPGQVDRLLRTPLERDDLYDAMVGMRRRVALQRAWQATLDRITEAVIITDGAGRVRTFNAAAQRMFQWTAQEMRGVNITRLMPAPHREQHDCYINRYLAGGAPQVLHRGRVEQGVRRDGRRFPIFITASDISDASDVRFVAVIRDLTEEREREVLRRRALRDPLTNLPNRDAALQALRSACARGQHRGERFVLLYLDLDRFKPINDEHGHAVGDQVLVTVARRLRRALATSDLVARIGGDEFLAILMGVADRQQAAAIADRVRAAIVQPIRVAPRYVELDVSIGVAVWPDDGATAEELIACGDAAMYRVKHTHYGGRASRDETRA